MNIILALLLWCAGLAVNVFTVYNAALVLVVPEHARRAWFPDFGMNVHLFFRLVSWVLWLAALMLCFQSFGGHLSILNKVIIGLVVFAASGLAGSLLASRHLKRMYPEQVEAYAKKPGPTTCS